MPELEKVKPIMALTISQPFASMIATGEKWVENRTWPSKYRGPLAIHAGKGSQYLDKSELSRFDTGCIVAVGELVACVTRESLGRVYPNQKIYVGGSLTADEILKHDHTEGPWCWILQDVLRFDEPIPCRGAQGLWKWQPPPAPHL